MFKWLRWFFSSHGPKVGDKVIYMDKKGVEHDAEINHIESNGMVGITLKNGKRVFPVRPGEWGPE